MRAPEAEAFCEISLLFLAEYFSALLFGRLFVRLSEHFGAAPTFNLFASGYAGAFFLVGLRACCRYLFCSAEEFGGTPPFERLRG